VLSFDVCSDPANDCSPPSYGDVVLESRASSLVGTASLSSIDPTTFDDYQLPGEMLKPPSYSDAIKADKWI
jgi:hypothetical protein